MVTNRKVSGRASTTAVGLALGAGASMTLTLVGCAGVAWLVARETIQEGAMGYGIMVVLVAAAMVGALITSGRVKRQRLIMCLASGGIYFLILIAMTALFFGGQYGALGSTALCIACGSGGAAFLKRDSEKGVKRKRRKYASC